ncbi:MAG TPA: GWxTD domain-containing protein [Brumimicrobium sp.]|nr:GWxTD domain-containing protein [Brumimicrobium sp.]
MRYSLLFLATILCGFSFSQDKNLKAYLNEGQFYTPESGNYIEIQLNFKGYSLKYITKDNSTFAELEISQVFSQNDTIVFADRYLLKSPELIDSIVEDFFDIQKYPLAPGEYRYDLVIKDVNSKNKALEVNKNIEMKDLSRGLSISSFTAAETIYPNPQEQSIYTRIGYDVVPMLGNYYPTEIQNMLYYLEVYNTDSGLEDSVYVVEQKIVGRDVNLDLEQYTRYFRYKGSPIQPVSKVIDISLLPTGAYTLELNILNRDKIVLGRSSYDFDRNNTEEVNEIAYESIILDPAFQESIHMDSTVYYVASLIPISGQAEVKNIIRLLKKKDKEQNYRYLQAFWKQADPKNAYEAWMKYKAQVLVVEKLFATNFQVGFETDRGRVFLQYGSPSSVIEQPSSPAEYPYEIWQYDQIKQYSNRRFVFYSPTNLNEDYRLLHSDMLGEIQNHRWKYALNKRNTPDSNLDDPTGGASPHFGGNSSIYYNSY